MKIFALIILFFLSKSDSIEKDKLILIPFYGIGNIVLGESTMDDVKKQFGNKKLQKTWHKGVEFDLFGKREFKLYYSGVGTFSTLTNKRNRTVVCKITLDSDSDCKTIDGWGIGSNYNETIKELGLRGKLYQYRKHRGDGYNTIGTFNNMDVWFSSADTLSCVVTKIEIFKQMK